MIDFTSSLYLDLRHGSSDLPPWAQLTTGVPAVLAEPPVAHALASRLARLTGVDMCVLARSTLHAFWDLIVWLGHTIEPATILLDAGTYAVARWGVERAECRGIRTCSFAHHNAAHLEQLIVEASKRGQRPIVVADGFCPGCGEFAPIRNYFNLAQRFGGVMVLDDTQSLGIAGPQGGGSLRRAGVTGPVCILVNSLAKGFGTPLAFVGGNRRLIEQYRTASETRAHTSPPSTVDLHAAMHALDVNQVEGNARRRALAALIARFRRGLSRLGLAAQGEVAPVQTLRMVSWLSPTRLHAHLAADGIRTVLHQPLCSPRERVTFLLTARHTPTQVDAALASLAAAACVQRSA
jgi:8-amino-7-oxononanoate synthase